jgi:hypothetical protein
MNGLRTPLEENIPGTGTIKKRRQKTTGVSRMGRFSLHREILGRKTVKARV